MAINLDVLAVVAHPDDAELTCGGTLIRMADAGYRVGVLDLTGGETGTRGDAAIRRREAEAASKVMGLAVRENLGLPDAGLQDDQESRHLLARAIRRLGPRVLILPHWRSRHPDHETAARLGRAAAFLAGLKNVPGEGDPCRPEKILHPLSFIEHGGKPTFVVDISEQFERKLQAVRCFASQFEGRTEAGELFPNGQPLLDLIRTHALHYGSQIRALYGEPFLTRETVRVDDIVSMGVKSI